MNKQYAVIGNPVLHSLSPLIHQRAFDYYGIEARYFAYEVENFADFMQYFRTGSTQKNAQKFVPYSYLGDSVIYIKRIYRLFRTEKKIFLFRCRGFPLLFLIKNMFWKSPII